MTTRIFLIILHCLASATLAADSNWPKVVRLGVVPTEGGTDTKERFKPLRDHLQKELGVDIEVVSTSNYQGVITAMANKQVEFAYFGPKSYVEAASRADAEALVLELNASGERGYHSIFIVPANSKVQTLADARGLKFAFTDPNSTSGKLIPATIVHDQMKSSPEKFFGEVVFSGSHGTSILQVAQGELPIAATNDMDLAKMIQKGSVRAEDVKVVYKSDLIPGSPFAARRDVPTSLKEAFTAAILKLNGDTELLKKFASGGYALVRDDEYDIIRATAEYLKAEEAAKSK